MKLELAVLAGADSKKWLADFATQIDRLEKLVGKKGMQAIAGDEDEAAPAPEEDEDDDILPAKPETGKFEDDDEDEDEDSDDDADEDEDDADDDEEEEFPVAAKAAAKKGKAKKITVDDVNDACKARALSVGGKKGRAEVLAILKKKFKTESVSELKPEQYGACITAMAIPQ